ncbi:MAG TPA: DinB family protein, partial [Gemmata sp.]|nr:DinB family protein [Gemmata sp.]
MTRLREALDQIDFVRRYSLERIETVPQSEWFTIPPGGVTHVAWQVGHLALTEYRLCLARLRPRTTEDEGLLPIDS